VLGDYGMSLSDGRTCARTAMLPTSNTGSAVYLRDRSDYTVQVVREWPGPHRGDEP
jgi:hypothetical protein